MREKEKMLDKNNMTLSLEKMEKQSIGNHQISKNELSKKKSLQEKGITLIALVVTIIILLILAGVTLNIALSDNGLFSKTQEAADKYKKAQSDETETIRQIATQMYNEYVGATITGYTPSGEKETCDIETNVSGYSTKQTFTRDPMIWRIWDFDGTTLRIIGEPTSKDLYFKGAVGYNNGLWAMDYVCNTLYSTDRTGVTATNLKRSDIQKVSTYDYTQYKHVSGKPDEVTGTTELDTIQFGESRSYDDAKYPEMWEINDQNWNYNYSDDEGATGTDKECKIWEDIGENGGKMGSGLKGGTSRVTFKQSYYAHAYKENEFINKKYYDLIFKKGDNKTLVEAYWLETRDINLNDNNCRIGFAHIFASTERIGLWGNCVCEQGKDDIESYSKLRPIVSIDLQKSGCQITKVEGGDGEVTYNLSWN